MNPTSSGQRGGEADATHPRRSMEPEATCVVGVLTSQLDGRHEHQQVHDQVDLVVITENIQYALDTFGISAYAGRSRW